MYEGALKNKPETIYDHMKVGESRPLRWQKLAERAWHSLPLAVLPGEMRTEHGLWADAQTAFLMCCFLEHRENPENTSFVQLMMGFH